MNRRVIENRSINKSGSGQRLIYYSQSNSEKRFEYSNPSQKIIGIGKQHVKGPQSRELRQFRPLYVMQSPDSMRTIIPETINPEESSLKRSKSFIYLNKESHVSSEDITQPIHTLKRRANDSKVYSCLCKDHQFYEENPPIKKQGIKQIPYRKYDTASQIINLPGGRKRETKEINDDKSAIVATLLTKSNSHKQLMGNSLQTNYNYRTTIKVRNPQPTDIFNANPLPHPDSSSNINGYTKYNSLRMQSGRRHNINRTHNEDCKEANTERVRMKCQGYKNISQFQLC